MTDSAASFVAIILGIGVFLVIVAVGWRSVQNRRVLRLQGANGQETIIVAGEDDDVSSVVTTTTTTDTASAEPAPEFSRGAVRNETADDAETDVPRTTTS
jgi:cytoskeletal protein RodZ